MTKQNRIGFRQWVFARDSDVCVVPGCGRPPVDAHHIIERALWKGEEEGGYFLENGASLCETHHKHAEADFIPPHALRAWCGIDERRLPKGLDANKIYTKWGVPVPLPNRAIVKYPHTPYFTFSPTADDKDIDDCGYFDINNFVGKPLIISIKLDGSNAMLTREKVTARNGYDAKHKSFDMLKAIHAGIKDKIPEHIQIFGEWLYAKHSIHYAGDDLFLESPFYVFAVYDQESKMWLNHFDVVSHANNLGFPVVPRLHRMVFDNQWDIPAMISAIAKRVIEKGHEGIVVRSEYPFYWGQFAQNVAKFVRPNHVQTDEHWSQKPIVRNEIRRVSGG